MTKVAKNAPPHYLVTVEGSYACKANDGGKQRKGYKFDIPVPLKVTALIPTRKFDPATQEHFWQDVEQTLDINQFGILSYLLKENRIQNRIRKQDSGFVTLLKYEITDTKASSPDIQLPSNPHVLNKAQLIRFIKSNSWPIDLDLFTSLKSLREAVMNYKEAPEAYAEYERLIRRKSAAGSAFTKAQEDLESFYGEGGEEDTEEDTEPRRRGRKTLNKVENPSETDPEVEKPSEIEDAEV